MRLGVIRRLGAWTCLLLPQPLRPLAMALRVQNHGAEVAQQVLVGARQPGLLHGRFACLLLRKAKQLVRSASAPSTCCSSSFRMSCRASNSSSATPTSLGCSTTLVQRVATEMRYASRLHQAAGDGGALRDVLEHGRKAAAQSVQVSHGQPALQGRLVQGRGRHGVVATRVLVGHSAQVGGWPGSVRRLSWRCVESAGRPCCSGLAAFSLQALERSWRGGGLFFAGHEQKVTQSSAQANCRALPVDLPLARSFAPHRCAAPVSLACRGLLSFPMRGRCFSSIQ